MYAQSHRAKNTPEATTKAEVNEQMVRDIQAVIDQVDADVLEQTAQFAVIAYSEGVTPKNQQSQIGAHFEEVGEMLNEIQSSDEETQTLILNVKVLIEALATKLKQSEPTIEIIDRLAFLDSIADQLVTATIAAQLLGMNPLGALKEVNRSNYSKLNNGIMEKHPETKKWLKGPNFSPADLSPFV